MNVRYRVTLSEAERAVLNGLIGGGRTSARVLKRAQILLAAADGVTEEQIASVARTSAATIYRIKGSSSLRVQLRGEEQSLA